jgi:hypothetical protein
LKGLSDRIAIIQQAYTMLSFAQQEKTITMASKAFTQSTSNRYGRILAYLTSKLYTSQQNECWLFLRKVKDGFGLRRILYPV